MSVCVTPPSVANPNRTESSELRSERLKMRGTFGAHRAPKMVGVSDAVQLATTELSRSAHRAEKAWLRSLTRAEKSLLRQGRRLA